MVFAVLLVKLFEQLFNQSVHRNNNRIQVKGYHYQHWEIFKQPVLRELRVQVATEILLGENSGTNSIRDRLCFREVALESPITIDIKAEFRMLTIIRRKLVGWDYYHTGVQI